MCGIISYIGDREVIPLLINGLKKLEYRGYDSSGICVVDNNNNLKIVKRSGKISELEKQPELNEIKGSIGIAHTRWATHGDPNTINAHPHTDCKNEIAIVHNGIIENFYALKELLIEEGHKFTSETDSEVIAHLIEKFYDNNLEDAVVEALKVVEGAFGLAIIHQKENKLVAARKGSPLLLGIGNNEMFVASDATPLLNYTKKVIYLNDNEIAVMDKNNYKIKNLDGNVVDSKIHEIKWTIDQIEKKDFKHFMLKEIFEQPEAIENTLRGRIKNNEIKLTVTINLIKIKRVIITACGTSWHSALIGKYIIEKITKIPVEVDYASEFRYRNPIINENDLIIVISQSGETADTLAALREAKSKNAKTLGIINVVGSSIAREVESGIYLHAGPEIGVASTKAFTCQIIALILLSLYIKQNKNEKIDENMLKELISLPSLIKDILKTSLDIRKLAETFKDSKNLLYLGRGINFPVALEGALKLKEVSYIHAEGYPAAEIKHGPIALIDKDMPVIFISPNDDLYEKILSNMQEVKTRKGEIIAVINNGDERISKLTDYKLHVPKVREEFSPILNIIPLQLFAYHFADLKNIDVDKPRNLAKSVTVE